MRMNNFSDKVKQRLMYYVYALIDPRNDEIFYIGKGVNDRVFQHETENIGIESDKHRRIESIKRAGKDVKKVIVLYGLTEDEAFAAEAALINVMQYLTPDKLTNIVSGHHSDPVMTVEGIERFYGAEILTEKDIFHNLLVIKINTLYDYNMTDREIMDCARGHWRINVDNAKNMDYLVAVYRGQVVGVYENMQWYSSGIATEFYPQLSEDNLKLTNRKYCTCNPAVKAKYIDKSISAVVKDTQNPVSYIWGRKNSLDVLQPYYDLFSGRLGRNMRMFEEDFQRDMEKMGYEMDGFTRYKALGKPDDLLSGNDKWKIKKAVEDVDYLTATSMLYSQWRWLTHWAYMDYCRYEDDTEFFKAVLERIFELSK